MRWIGPSPLARVVEDSEATVSGLVEVSVRDGVRVVYSAEDGSHLGVGSFGDTGSSARPTPAPLTDWVKRLQEN